VYGGGGATFYVDETNREDRMIVSRFAMSEECVRWVAGKFYLNDSGLTVITRNESALIQPYVDKYLLARSSDIYATARGTAQKNMDVPLFRRMPIRFPESVEEQKRIVSLIDDTSKKIGLAQVKTQSQIKVLAELRQSILNKAFDGGL
jgi:type I restriction enzyme S subunit